MYILNSKALSVKLKEGTLSQKEIFHYFFANTIISAIQIQWLSIYASNGASIVSKFLGLLYIIIVCIGTIVVFRTNQKGDGKSFVERYICISFPILIRVILIYIFFQLLYRIISQFIRSYEIVFMSINALFILLPLIIAVYFYYLIHSYLRYICSVSN